MNLSSTLDYNHSHNREQTLDKTSLTITKLTKLHKENLEKEA